MHGPALGYSLLLQDAIIMFIFGKWHGWQAANYMLSDEETKQLREFPDVDSCVNWLFINGEKEAARALNKTKGGNK